MAEKDIESVRLARVRQLFQAKYSGNRIEADGCYSSFEEARQATRLTRTVRPGQLSRPPTDRRVSTGKANQDSGVEARRRAKEQNVDRGFIEVSLRKASCCNEVGIEFFVTELDYYVERLHDSGGTTKMRRDADKKCRSEKCRPAIIRFGSKLAWYSPS